MDMTARGLTEEVLRLMDQENMEESDAIAKVSGMVSNRPRGIRELWENESTGILRRWLGEALRGTLYSGPRPSVLFNSGRNRRKERSILLPQMGALVRVPGGNIKPIGELDRTDLGSIIEYRRVMAKKNHYHAGEWQHIRSFLKDDEKIKDISHTFDGRAVEYLETVARTVKVEKAG